MPFRRLERPVRTSTYALFSFAGAAALTVPPVTITAVIGEFMMTVLGILLLVGGLVAGVSSYLYRWLFEYVALYAIGAGVGIYITALWSITVDDSLSRLMQTILITTVAGFLLQRWIDLHTLTGFATRKR
ncbi:hypothetical protein CH253_08060 [Rhodococcus sp. 06-156-3C]|nr:hypothetical protein CH253_08060 [Rhodococcus sp. 06-156-3C]